MKILVSIKSDIWDDEISDFIDSSDIGIPNYDSMCNIVHKVEYLFNYTYYILFLDNKQYKLCFKMLFYRKTNYDASSLKPGRKGWGSE